MTEKILKEEIKYKQGYWFDGVQWTKEDVQYIMPSDKLRDQFKGLVNPGYPFSFIKGEFNKCIIEELFRKFLKYKEIEYTDWHEKGLEYWSNHPGVKIVFLAMNDCKWIVGIDINIVYNDIVVSQACFPVDYTKFYENRAGHMIAVNLPVIWGKPAYIGYGEKYRYVNRKKGLY